MVIEIHAKKGQKFPAKMFPGCREAKGGVWKADLPPRRARKYLKKARRMHCYAICYAKKYGRSVDYRARFIAGNPPGYGGRYRCVYCGRMVKTEDMCVDHVIPVGVVKREKKFQKKLAGGVNDLSNLVPSCRRCNEKKWDSTSPAWRIRARLGCHESYWVLRLCVCLGITVTAVWAVYHFTDGPVTVAGIVRGIKAMAAHAAAGFKEVVSWIF